jgi:hypothetical protein
VFHEEIAGLLVYPAPGVSHYISGSDPTQWRTHVSHYARVRYRAVYPGVDLLYYGNQENIEHDFVVAPRADPKQIRFAVTGAERIELDGQDDLIMLAGSSEVRLRKPTIYQGAAKTRREVAGHYTLSAGNEVSFALGEYDSSLPLVIDPVLVTDVLEAAPCGDDDRVGAVGVEAGDLPAAQLGSAKLF